MVYTFLKAQGKNIGQSLLEEDKISTAKAVLDKAKATGVQMILSSDFVVMEDFDKPEGRKTVAGEIPDGWQGVDIGPESRQKFKDVLAKAKTIVWNGPLGVFEIDAYAEGTQCVAEYIAGLKGVTSIIGGGDSAAAVAKFNVEAGMTHISTGGGASLEFLEGKELPGVAVLNNA
ncbi:MAG TPA: phosphoglycerate kinase, partial [Candidatus Omnitrophota bacterium]|nr:phosphoglycerate kinase [Candidatus Omnitrophota bacterium]